ncbi:acyltransferase family protein [Streptomyces fungicidicus]|uniref:Acyltransferase n=1 Tax=Streptomyces fungicidicus TaxID=68203 RepID=A0A494V1R7_9ACTN|nr:acyltransferase [Streptomyces fungicidicus]AYL36078.1 acyltransferase [Streptomyces fungicidicus]
MPRTAPPTAAPTAGPAAQPAAAPAARGGPGRERRDDIDLLRVVCTAAVVLVHASAEFLDAGHRTTGVLGDSAGRFAVPAFFAMAGWAALVGSPVRGDAQLLTRLGRILRPMTVWTAVYLLWQYLSGRQPPHEGLRDAAHALFGSVEPAFHLWYLYTYVPLLLLLGVAVLVLGRRAAPRRSLLLLAAFAVAPAFAGDARTLTGLPLPSWDWSVSLYSLAYAVAGAALLAARRRGPRGLWLAGTAAALVALTVYQLTVRHPAAYGSVAVAAPTFALLGAVSGVRVPERARALLGRLSDASFGTYLVHLLFVTVLVGPVAEAVPHGIAAPVALAVTAVAAAVLSFAVSVLWGRLGMRKWLG